MATTQVYIVCRGHSGSTMLELLLNRNRNIAAMGEIDLLPLQVYRDGRARWIGTCSCGERPHECPQWGQVLRQIEKDQQVDLQQDPFSFKISNTGLEEEYGWKSPGAQTKHIYHQIVRQLTSGRDAFATSNFTKRYRQWVANRDLLIKQYAEIAGVDVVVDASKDPLQMVDLAHYSSLPTKILFLTRDVRGLAWSAKRRGRSTVKQEVHEWTSLNQQIIALLGRIPKDQFLHVRYEDLCSGLDSELTRIHEFLGIPYDPVDPDTEMQNRHTIAGNQTRFRLLDEIREDKAWEENLSEAELTLIDDIAGPTMKLLQNQF